MSSLVERNDIESVSQVWSRGHLVAKLAWSFAALWPKH